MRNFYTLTVLLFCFYANAQNVGINTTEPKAALDVNGNLVVRTVDNAAVANTYDYLVVNPTTKEVQKRNGNFDTNLSIAKASLSNSTSLLSVGLFNGYNKIQFNTAEINAGSYYSTSSFDYTVPSTGIYEINFYFRYGTGLQAALLSGDVTVGILKEDVSTSIIAPLDKRKFAGVNLAVLINVTISTSEINSVYKLNAGDKISFGVNKGTLNLGLLGSSAAEFVIKKISN